jgi:nucleoside 2-deoxyribosyltransferase
MSKLTIYLAGAIRDGVKNDILWREQMILGLQDEPVSIINPIGGKTYNEGTGKWLVSGVESTAQFIVDHDFWAVDRSDIVVFNFQGLAEDYPNIGTLIEFGRSTGTKALRYSIIPSYYVGHDNQRHFKGLHPFIAKNSAVVFETADECLDFLRRHVQVLTGMNPHYVDR